MKRCPECRRDYVDDTLLYCLDDGNALLDGPASGKSQPPAAAGSQFDDPQTAILHPTVAPVEGLTRAQINTTDATAILQEGAGPQPPGNLTEDRSVSAKRAAKPLVALAAVIVIIVGAYVGYLSSSAGQISSIAVLPFENTGGNADSEYLSDGLAESLIYRLSQIPDLKVSPRSSVFRYKGKDTDAERIGEELGVDAVMSGRRGRWSTDRVRLCRARR
jgi:hypothetical protein